MLKRIAALTTLCLLLVLPTLAQDTDTPTGTMFITGSLITVDSETITIDGLSNALPALLDGADGMIPTYYPTYYFANGWANTEGMTVNATLQGEAGSGDDFEVFSIPVVLSAPVLSADDRLEDLKSASLSFAITYDFDNATRTDSSKQVTMTSIEELSAFTIIIPLTPEFSMGLEAGITALGDRLTSSRPCSPRTRC